MTTQLGILIGAAMDLTRGGRLDEATAAIQRALRREAAPAALRRGHASNAGPVPDRLVPDRLTPDRLTPDGLVLDGLVREAPRRDAPANQPAADVRVRFDRRTYTGSAGSRDYKLFVPAGAADQPRPLIVMLHGCTQDPDDFAAGTRMNELAQAGGFLVLYPAQAPRSNASKCWNWFMPGDQQRGHGEPALLAGMTLEILATHSIDPQRVYIAGLSAGGAMAAIMGRAYPDIYAAVGIHSGLPQGAAHDMASAFSAMKSGTPETSVSPAAASAPVIVFHGDRDGTVHPHNGIEVVSALLGSPGVDGKDGSIESSGSRARTAGRDYTRTVYRRRGAAADAPSVAEHWLVHGAGHAWSGGNPRGSYTDAHGPDASREMVRFFTEHPRTA